MTREKLKWMTVSIRWLEKAGLQRDAVRSRKVARLPPLPPPRLLPGGAYKFEGRDCTGKSPAPSRRTVTTAIENQSAFFTQEPVPEAFIICNSVYGCVDCLNAG